jgi:glutathione synthase/RimK-type ligase-like ATP-grasp enzyme
MNTMIVSTVGDAHARAVMAALQAQGAAVELLDLTEFPSQLALTMAFEDGRRRFRLSRMGGGTLDLDSIGAVWWRRPQGFGVPDSLADPAHRQYALSEAATAFDGLYQSMNALWVNEPARDIVAGHKPYQLALALQLGFSIPVTLMTNDPEEAREFWQRHPGEVIYKQFKALPATWRETRKLRDEETALLDSVRMAPVIFQRFVEAVADVRVTIIGDEIFSGSTDPRKGAYPVDFRYSPELKWEKHPLPSAIEDRLRVLMRRLGLEYGAIDLRLTPEGEYVFLEVNPAGQFLWVEMETGLKITDALAAHLVKGQRTHAGTGELEEVEFNGPVADLRRKFQLVAAR